MFANNFNGKILNIGHRGAPEVAPENTVASFKKALEMGADGIELDVSLSKDGAIMVFHDYILNRKTDGKGLLAKKTRAELQSLDAGLSFPAQYGGAQIPTLGEVVESIDEQAFIMIEIKTNIFGKAGIEEAVAAFVKRYNLYERVVVSSFSPASLRRVKRTDDLVPIGLLHFPMVPWKQYLDCFQNCLKAEVLHPYHKNVNEDYMCYAGERGCKVIAWTLKTGAEMLSSISMGVDGVITDFPHLFHRIYSDYGKGQLN